MVYVTEDFVATELAKRLPFAFRAVEPEDESVDGDVEISPLDDPETKLPFSVQVGSGYLVINETGYSTPGDSSSIWVRDHGMFGVRDDDFVALAAKLKELLPS